MTFIEALNDYYEREEFKGSNSDEFFKAKPNLKMYYLGSSYNFNTETNTYMYLRKKEDGFYIEWFRTEDLINEKSIDEEEVFPFTFIFFKYEQELVDYLNSMSFESLLNEAHNQ